MSQTILRKVFIYRTNNNKIHEVK